MMRNKLLSVLLAAILVVCQATQEEAIQMNDSGEGSQCDNDEGVAKICLACSSLPFNTEVTLATCCSMETAFLFCNACINDPDSCGSVLDEIDELKTYTEALEDYYDTNDQDSLDLDNYDDNEQYIDDENEELEDLKQKRFGTLFMRGPKRYGRFRFGKRAPEKRYGRLYMGSGSYFGKRSDDNLPNYDLEPKYDDLDEISDVDKRFGYVLGSSYKLGKRGDDFAQVLPDKRYGQLMFGQNKWYGKRDYNEDAYDGSDIDKRYERLFVGNKGWFGKRSDEEFENTMDKRYGRLFVGNKGWFGKRSDEEFENDMDKRYGRLFVGNKGWFGKRSDEKFENTMDKRYGRLFVGNKGWFGKRSDEEFENTMDKRYGRLFVGNKGWFGKRSELDSENRIEKRYGRLFVSGKGWFGKRSDSKGDNVMDKRYGRLFYGKQGWFGKRSGGDIDKRFGRLFMGRRRGSWFG